MNFPQDLYGVLPIATLSAPGEISHSQLSAMAILMNITTLNNELVLCLKNSNFRGIKIYYSQTVAKV